MWHKPLCENGDGRLTADCSGEENLKIGLLQVYFREDGNHVTHEQKFSWINYSYNGFQAFAS